MDILVVSPTKSGVKHVVFNVVKTDTWEQTETTHLTLPIHETPSTCTQKSLLDERLLRALSSRPGLYLLYGVLFFWLRAYLHILRHGSEYDVIWLHNPRLLWFLPSRFTRQTLITYHGPLHGDKAESHTSFRRFYYRTVGWFEQVGLGRHSEARFTAVSTEVIQSIHAAGVTTANTFVVQNAVNVKQFDPEVTGKRDRFEWGTTDDPVLLYVGRLAPEKGIQRLLATAARLADMSGPVPTVVLVGDGPLRGDIESSIEENSLNNVILEGYVDHGHVASAYTAADYFVLPSKWEGASHPLSLCEALASGRPAFVSDIETLSKLTETSVVTAIPFEDPDAAARQIQEQIKEADWESLSAGARTFAEENLDWEQRAQQYLEVCDTVAS